MDQNQLTAAVLRLFKVARPTQIFRTGGVRDLLSNLLGEEVDAASVRSALYALPDFAHPRPYRGQDGLAWTFGAADPAPPRRQRPRRPARKSIAESQRLKRQ